MRLIRTGWAAGLAAAVILMGLGAVAPAQAQLRDRDDRSHERYEIRADRAQLERLRARYDWQMAHRRYAAARVTQAQIRRLERRLRYDRWERWR